MVTTEIKTQCDQCGHAETRVSGVTYIDHQRWVGVTLVGTSRLFDFCGDCAAKLSLLDFQEVALDKLQKESDQERSRLGPVARTGADDEQSGEAPIAERDMQAEIESASQQLRHGFDSALENTIGRCMLLGFTPDHVVIEQGFRLGSEQHPVKVVDKNGVELARIYVTMPQIDGLEGDSLESQVVRVFSEAVLERVRAKLGTAEA